MKITTAPIALVVAAFLAPPVRPKADVVVVAKVAASVTSKANRIMVLDVVFVMIRMIDCESEARGICNLSERPARPLSSFVVVFPDGTVTCCCLQDIILVENHEKVAASRQEIE